MYHHDIESFYSVGLSMADILNKFHNGEKCRMGSSSDYMQLLAHFYITTSPMLCNGLYNHGLYNNYKTNMHEFSLLEGSGAYLHHICCACIWYYTLAMLGSSQCVLN